MDGIALLGLGTGSRWFDKATPRTSIHPFFGVDWMAEDEEVSVSEVMGPSWMSSTTASTGFNTALEGVGAAVMGVGTLMDSEPLVLGGLAMVAVSCTANGMEFNANKKASTYIMEETYYQGLNILLRRLNLS